MRTSLALAALALSACVGGSGGEGPARAAPQGFTLDSGGIDVIGTGLRIDFGRHGPGVIDSVTRLQGQAPRTIHGPGECGAPGVSAAAWPDGLVLVFRDNAFRGWQATHPSRSASGALSAGAVCPPA